MPQITAYQPEYYKDFACLGQDCRNTCCRHWRVEFSKKDYDRYMIAGSDGLRRKLEEHVVFQPGNPSKARVRMDENGFCPFLDAEGLCEIHAECGRHSLCHTCKTYPRVLCNVNGELEAFLDMSCEEAARLALFNPDIMKMGVNGAEYDNHIDHALDAGDYTPFEDGPALFWNMRVASLYVLQNRRYPVWLRAVILGLFTKQADAYISEGRESELPGLCEECMANIDEGAYDGYAGQIPDRPDMKAELILQVLEQTQGAFSDGRGAFTDALEQAKKGLCFSGEGLSVKEIADNITGPCRRFYAPFFRDHQYVFENYLVNAVFMTGFPFTYEREGSIYKNYVNLAVRYAALKLLLAGMAGYHQLDFGREHVVRTVAAFTRVFDHGKGILENISDKLEALGATEMGTLCLLLKD